MTKSLLPLSKAKVQRQPLDDFSPEVAATCHMLYIEHFLLLKHPRALTSFLYILRPDFIILVQPQMSYHIIEHNLKKDAYVRKLGENYKI